MDATVYFVDQTDGLHNMHTCTGKMHIAYSLRPKLVGGLVAELKLYHIHSDPTPCDGSCKRREDVRDQVGRLYPDDVQTHWRKLVSKLRQEGFHPIPMYRNFASFQDADYKGYWTDMCFGTFHASMHTYSPPMGLTRIRACDRSCNKVRVALPREVVARLS